MIINSNLRIQESKSNILNSLLSSMVVFLLIILLVVFSIIIPNFFALANFINIIKQISIIGIISLGLTLAIITGGIDLSVGAILAFTLNIGGIAINNGWSIWSVYPLVLITGIILGAINGFFITKLKISELIVTLATLSIFRGAIMVITKGYEVYNIPSVFTVIGKSYYPILLIGVLYLIFVIINSYTKFGRNLYSIGGNVEAAIFSGVPVNRYKMYIYVTIGFLCALAAILSMGRVMHIYPTIGTGYELRAIAAVVIGGTSIWGGSGSVIRTLLGATLMGVILVGLTMMGVHPYWHESITGLLIIFAISIDSLKQYKKFKR